MFKEFIPYAAIDVLIISGVNGVFQESYDTIEELLEEEGNIEFTEVHITSIRLNDNYYMSLQNLLPN